MGTPDRTTVAEHVDEIEQRNCHEIAMKIMYMHCTLVGH